MLGISKGAMETHYGESETVDSVLTPDFRIVLPGPGEFNLAISADAKGNTCVGSLQGSTASAVVAELLGSGTYEVKPSQQVLFREGRLDSVETPAVACGCPAAPVPALQASVDSSKVVSEDEAGNKLQLENSNDPSRTNTEPEKVADSNAAQSDSAKPAESTLVFSGEEIAKAKQKNTSQKPKQAAVPPAPTAEAAKLPPSAKAPEPLPAVVVLPPADPKPKKGFFGKIKGFFGSIFR